MRTYAFAIALLVTAGFSGSAFAAKYKGRLVPGDWAAKWSETLHEGLANSDLLKHEEKQIEQLCPGYTQYADKRKLFWTQLMVSLGWKESLHGPENYVHFNGGTNDGLYQINPKLRTYYDCKDFNLFDPFDNIRCAVKMADKLVKRFDSFLTGTKGGMAAYWQPLRATNSYNRKNRQWILDHVKDACKTNEISYHSVDVPAAILEQADYTINTIDDLGLSPEDLEADDPAYEHERQPAEFEFDPFL